MTTWEPVIGIEVHVELRTESKMFCGCAVSFGAPPNTNICPVCLGLPGSLPVTNQQAIEWLTRIGLALHSEIAPHSVFHRKNYYYADIPKNYQISQYDLPLCVGGWLDIDVDGREMRVGIERAHMEEDTGKTLHRGIGGRIHAATSSLLDFNRAGVPLVEIVSRPDLRSAAEARAYAQDLRALVAELGVSDARMEEGSIRFDANVSVRPQGSETLGTKVEIKNMNSFRSLERAIASEIERQIHALEAGENLIQETRHWDEEAGVTHGLRTKEGSSDYRYFTEPDLVPLAPSTKTISKLQADLPELPADRRRRYASHGLDPHLVTVLAGADRGVRDLFAATVDLGADPIATTNWLTGEATAIVRRRGIPIEETGLSASRLKDLLQLVAEGLLSASAAKDVLGRVIDDEGEPRAIAESHDLLQVTDEAWIAEAVAQVIDANPDATDRFRAGEEKVVGFLVGQVMRATGGKADPQAVNRLLREQLSALA